MIQVSAKVVNLVLAYLDLELAGLSIDRVTDALEEVGVLDAADDLHFGGRTKTFGNYAFLAKGEEFKNFEVLESQEDVIDDWTPPAPPP
jgi:hypothetical protein